MATDKVTHWYLSFAGNGGFLGAVIVTAPGANAARTRAQDLNCFPSDDVAIVPIPPEAIPDPSYCDRLLNLAEIETIAGPLAGPMTATDVEATWSSRVTRSGDILPS